MITSARQWFRRNRTTFAVGASVVGAGYLAVQYVTGRITETRQRMSDDRIAREKYLRHSSQTKANETAYDGASSRIRKTAHSRYWPYYPPRPKIY
jgi:peroxin-3